MPAQKAKEELHIATYPELYGVTVVSGTDISNSFSRHVHESYGIGIVDRGRRELEISGAYYSVGPGEVFIINAGEPHSCRSGEGGSHSYCVITLPSELIRQIAGDLIGTSADLPLFSHTTSGDPRLATMLGDVIRLTGDPALTPEAEASLFSLIEHLFISHLRAITRVNPPKDTLHTVDRIKQHIDRHCTEPLSLRDLSLAFAMSPFHLNRLFCHEVGVPPHTYLLHQRVHRARDMLVSGMSPAEAALESGFADQSHFSRFFKRIVGTTPGRFAENNKER